MKILFIVSVFLAATAIMMDAFLAHGVERFLGESYTPTASHSLATAARYQLTCSLAMMLVLLFTSINPSIFLNFSLAFFVLGQLLFVGTIYAKYLFGIGSLAFLAPFGGVSFMLAFLVLIPCACFF